MLLFFQQTTLLPARPHHYAWFAVAVLSMLASCLQVGPRIAVFVCLCCVPLTFSAPCGACLKVLTIQCAPSHQTLLAAGRHLRGRHRDVSVPTWLVQGVWSGAPVQMLVM